MEERAAPIWCDGELRTRGEERAGDAPGVFETLRCAQGALFFVAQHLERLRRGALCLGLAWPPPWDPRAALADLVRELPVPGAALRLAYGKAADGALTLALTWRALEPLPGRGVSVHVAASPLDVRGPRAGIKSTGRREYDEARAEARAAGAWEALLVDPQGGLVEGSVSNVFLVRGGELATPGLESGCLPGIARSALLEELGQAPLAGAGGRPLRVAEARLVPDELLSAEEVFLTNSLVRVAPVARVLRAAGPPRELPGEAGLVARAARTLLERGEERTRWQVCRPRS
jgi:branched-subunit amino acid aminotransferase/4-amino-4-deoxychorismate lyase